MGKMSDVFFYDSVGGDRKYNADSMTEWLLPFFTSGVFQGALQVTANGNLTVTVGTGYVNIGGKVKIFREEKTLDLETPSGSLDRIDSVVVRRNDTARDFEIMILKGGNASNPKPSALVREGAFYDLKLADIYIGKGALKIGQEHITDTRMDKAVCGWVVSTVKELDFTQIKTQFEGFFTQWKSDKQMAFDTWFNRIKGQLGEDAAGNLQNQIEKAIEKLNQLSMDAVVLTGQQGKKVRFGIDAQGRYGYIKDGADSVTPFRNPTGHAVKEHVLEGEIFSTAEGEDLVGKMKNLPGSEFAKGIQNTAESIWLGMTAGAHITNDKDMGMPCVGIKRRELGNADSVDVLKGKTFTSAVGLKVAGTIEDYTDKVYTVTTTEEGGSGTITANIPDGLHREIKINQKAAFDAGKEYAAQHLPFSLLKVIEVGSGASYKTEAWFGAIVVAGIDQMTVTPGFTKLGGSKCLFYRADVPKGTTISISTTYNTDCSIIGVW